MVAWELWQSSDETQTTMFRAADRSAHILPGDPPRDRLMGTPMMLLKKFEVEDHEAAVAYRNALFGW